MRRYQMEEDESSVDSDRRNPRHKKVSSEGRSRRSEDSDSEPDSNDRGESLMAGDGTPPWPTGAERETERAGGEPLRAGDGEPPMPSAAEIEEKLEEGEITHEEEEGEIPPAEEEGEIPSEEEEGVIPPEEEEREIPPEEEEGESPPEEMERDGEGGPLSLTAADKGKEKVEDNFEEDVVRARPQGNPSSGAGNSNREFLVSDQQLEELKLYLTPRLGSRLERRSERNNEVTLKDLAQELSIYLLGSSKTAILPAKPEIKAEEVQDFRCHQEVVTNYYVIHKLPDREKLELYRVIWPDTAWGSSTVGKKRLVYWKNIFRDDLKQWDNHFGIRMYDGGHFLVLNLHPNGRPSCLSTTERKRFPIRNIPPDGPDNLGELIIVYQGTLNLNDFKLLRDRNESAIYPQNNVDVVNVIMKHYCRDRQYLESGRFFFEKDGGHDIGRVLTKRLGYFQSVRLLEIGLALNVDVIGTAFYKPDVNLVDVWNGLVTESRELPLMLPGFKADLFYRQSVPPNQSFSPDQVRIVNDYWRNLKIEVTIQSSPNFQNRKYTIDEVANTSATDQTIIEIATGKPKNLIEFMGRQYDWPREQKWNNLPAIKLRRALKTNSGIPPVEIFVPWACCFTSQASRVTGVMPSLLRLMQIKVDERYQNISKWMNKRYENSSYPAAEEHFKLRPDTGMLVVMPLTLKRPQLELGRSNGERRDSTGRRPAQPANSSFAYGPEQSFANPARIRSWSIISFDHPAKRDKEEIFIEELVTAAKKKGMLWDLDTRFPKAESSKGIIRYNPRQEWPRERLLGDLKLFTDAAEKVNQPLEFILCFMSDKMAMEYSAVKFFLDRHAGVPSQVILSRHYKMKHNGLDNLLLKINVKCGGTNFRIAQLQNMSLLQNTILMGLDVTHPKYGAKDTKFSIVALVATIDQSGVDYACRLKAQPSGQEMTDSESMKMMVTELLNVYKRNVGKYPERILLFRDGLSESQVFSNLRYEGTAILRAARALHHDDNRTYEPKLAMILSHQFWTSMKYTLGSHAGYKATDEEVVNDLVDECIDKRMQIKRHHTRFFAVRSRPSDPRGAPYEAAAKRQRTGASTSQARGNLNDPATNYVADNIQAGTVVYDTVTHPVEFDFYLCSQNSCLGTSRPTKYHVVLDQIAVGQLELYQTINTLCHTFQRSANAVALVTPVCYAHLAAARASLYLDQEIENARDPRRLKYQTLDLNAHIKLKDRLWFL